MSTKKYVSKISKGTDEIYIKDSEARTSIGSLETAIVSCTTATLPATLSTSTYYNITDTVNSVTLTLPTITDNSKVSVVATSFTTGTGTPSVTITSASSQTIVYFSGYTIKASTSYELNIMWNGTKWIVAYATIG